VVALIGRVVPIKDIKTFIRAIFIASRTLPDIQGWIVGPEEEDKAYALECRALVESLMLTDNVKFLGFQRIDEILPRVDLIALTSISEALPLVVLEGFAAGVPAITTDVGSCRQLIDGMEARWNAAQAAGLARVRRYYTKEQMVERYRALYEKLMRISNGSGASRPSGARCPVDHQAAQGAD
jgi:polysaccharide biosynthesis protein PelF